MQCYDNEIFSFFRLGLNTAARKLFLRDGTLVIHPKMLIKDCEVFVFSSIVSFLLSFSTIPRQKDLAAARVKSLTVNFLRKVLEESTMVVFGCLPGDQKQNQSKPTKRTPSEVLMGPFDL